MNRPHEKRRKPWEFFPKKASKHKEIQKIIQVENRKLLEDLGSMDMVRSYKDIKVLFKNLELDYKIPVSLVIFQNTLKRVEHYTSNSLVGKDANGWWYSSSFFIHHTGYDKFWTTKEVPNNPLSRIMYKFTEADILQDNGESCIIWRKL